MGLLVGLGGNYIPQWADGSHSGSTPQPGQDGSPDTCHYSVKDHRLYAGFSTTMTDETDIAGGSNDDVREVQCLLLHMGISPGAVDGSFGAGTQKAVEKAQRRGHVTPDGRVGPKTWKVLRAAK
ncbi:peptidoglycan-binding domain-containing protein [Streptomyces sp. NPDC001222]|uniref:peptidoglycan-binding domain-containing protein n=1 Tax=Streptomyces sp. NPDC001222 TaxID=3364548 RepID=UPI0036799593